MRIIVILLIIVLLGLQYKLWIGDGSMTQWLRLEQKLDAQQQKNKQMLARNQVIDADIAELKSGEQALEEQARFELGMIKEGEVYYQFVD